MALIKCTGCGHTISDKAIKCPKCGVPVQNGVITPPIQETDSSTERPVVELKRSQMSAKHRILIAAICMLMLIVTSTMLYMHFSPYIDLRIRAEEGDKVAQYEIGLCYYNGTYVFQNYKEAVYWFRAAANQGHYDALKAVVNCCSEGKGGLSKEESLKWKMRLKDEEFYRALMNRQSVDYD